MSIEPVIEKPKANVLKKVQSLKGKEGRVAAIVPETGMYRTGKTLTDAIKKAKKAFPGRLFYVVGIGAVKH